MSGRKMDLLDGQGNVVGYVEEQPDGSWLSPPLTAGTGTVTIAQVRPASAPCHDCGVEPGQPHIDGCDVARCTVCGKQRITCDHRDSEVGWGQTRP